jgi:nicotinamide-nucleotide amidase
VNAEIIAVGSELLTASKLDTNSLWLTEQLNTLGVELVRKHVVGDDRERLESTIRNALASAEIVIVTGGLGPTEDDVTRDAAASALGRPLEFRQELCDAIEARFRTMRRPMAEINRRQAYLINGAEALPNTRGTAPGQWVKAADRVLMLLPGPPRELNSMFEGECLPRLRRLLPPQVIRTRFYRVACMPESDLDQLIAPIYTKYTNPATTVLAAMGDIQVHLRARCSTADECESLLAKLGGGIEAVLGSRIYTCAGDSLEACIGAELKHRKQTVAVAESLTGGMIGERITSVAGSSEYFAGGFLTYTDEAKHALLGVSTELLSTHGAVSEPVASAMAEGARNRTGADYVIAVTGFAGPDGGTASEPVGSVYTAVAAPDGTQVQRFQFGGSGRDRIRTLTTVWALEALRRRLLALPPL